MQEEVSCICDSCGEDIIIQLDLYAAANQVYVEDGPVCCRPNVIHVEIDEQDGLQARAELQ
jgi:hypothetical protein